MERAGETAEETKLYCKSHLKINDFFPPGGGACLGFGQTQRLRLCQNSQSPNNKSIDKNGILVRIEGETFWDLDHPVSSRSLEEDPR